MNAAPAEHGASVGPGPMRRLGRGASGVVRVVRQARFFFAFIGGLAVLLPPRLVTKVVWPHRPSRVSMAFCRILLWGLRIRVANETPISGGALIAANHVSWTDILVLASVRPVLFVAKAEVRGWPILGWLARLNGTVFVERAQRRAAGDQVAAVAEALRHGPVVLFAEGTTGNGDGVLPFHSTLFAAAEDRSVQPVAIDYRPQGRPWRAGERAEFAWDGDKTFWPHLLRIAGADGTECSLVSHPPLLMARGQRKDAARWCRDIVWSTIASRRAMRVSA